LIGHQATFQRVAWWLIQLADAFVAPSGGFFGSVACLLTTHFVGNAHVFSAQVFPPR
jgi:hypothetical protein